MNDTRTKIVCTIGPASRDEQTLRALINAGMDVARINFSHGTAPEHARDIDLIRRIAGERRSPIAIMADLQGPKLRIGRVVPEPLVLKKGDEIVLSSRRVHGEEDVVPLPHPDLISDVQVGDPLLIDDGTIELAVVGKATDELACRVVVAGDLFSHKGIAAPRSASNRHSRVSAITEKDRHDALFARDCGVDFIALSFVRKADEIEKLRSLLQSDGPSSHGEIMIIAKIEKREAIDDFDNILDVADGVMVARGDLGVEISVQKVPLYQKEIIRKCNAVGKPVITATQMLQSMVSSPKPTRAEASDVANAILDGTDAVMLSGETATGSYPVEAVEMMAKISAIVEKDMLRWVDAVGFAQAQHAQPITDAISDATATIAKEIKARLIVTSTFSGYTARMVARERPVVPIVALTPSEASYRQLALTWGVTTILVPKCETTDEMLSVIEETVLSLRLAQRGDSVVVTGGIPLGKGHTNFLKVHRLGTH